MAIVVVKCRQMPAAHDLYSPTGKKIEGFSLILLLCVTKYILQFTND